MVMDTGSDPSATTDGTRRDGAANGSGDASGSSIETQRLLHELQVHQIELMTQNEELRHAQAELEASRLRYFELYEFSPVGHLTLTEMGRMIGANLTISNWLERPRDTLFEQLFTSLIAPEDQDTYYLYGKRLRESREPQSCELRLLQRDGGPFWVRLETMTSRGHGPDFEYHVVLIDIRARKQAEDERLRLEERMNQNQKLEALGFLAAGIAHNLNNVLAVILGMASAREVVARDPKDLEAYRLICSACTQGRDVVEALMRFARPTLTTRMELELNGLVRELRSILAHSTRKRITIQEELASEPLWVFGDPGGIYQAIMNLCVNSLSAMAEGGLLTLRTRVGQDEHAYLEVEDNGEGMAPDVLTHAMEPFFSTKPVGQGTGLGLSMAYGVVKAHGGSLDLQSQPGQGTLARLRIPLIEPPVREVSTPAPNSVPTPSLRALQVLVVDDDELIRLTTVDMLETAGCDATAVDGGAAALDYLASHPLPDVVMLDMNMPGMDGKETLRRLRILYPELPVLIASGQLGIETWDCFQQPKVEILAKPFELKELLEKLARMT